MTPDEFRRHGHALVDWIADYLESRRGAARRLTGRSPARSGRCCPRSPPSHPEPFEAVLADLDRVVVPGLTNWQHPIVLRLLPGQRLVPVDPRRAGLGRPRGAGDAVGDEPGVHRGRAGDARLDGRAARPARPLPQRRAGRRRDPGQRLERRPLRRDRCPRTCDRRSHQPRGHRRAPRRLRHQPDALGRREGGEDRRHRQRQPPARRRRRRASPCAPTRWPRPSPPTASPVSSPCIVVATAGTTSSLAFDPIAADRRHLRARGRLAARRRRHGRHRRPAARSCGG